MDTLGEPKLPSKGKSKDRDGLYKRRDYWHYELIIDGRKRSFTTATKDYNEAKKKRAAAVRDPEQGRAPNDSGRKRFELVAADYIKHREATASAGTVRLEKERLRPLKRVIGNVMLRDVAPRTIRSYQAIRAAEVSNRTVNLETKLLRGILKHEGQWARLEPDYSRLQESGDSPGRALTPEESLRLFTTAESNQDWFVPYRAAIIANDSGMRGVELRNLRLRDVDLENRKITIRRSKNASGVRTVILTNDAIKALLALVDRAAKLNAVRPEHYLFPYKGRKGLGYDPARPTELHQERGSGHRYVKTHQQEGTDFQAVVLPINIEDWQHDQVSKQEGNDPAKADASIPKDCREWHISYRTNERKDCHDGSNERSPELR